MPSDIRIFGIYSLLLLSWNSTTYSADVTRYQKALQSNPSGNPDTLMKTYLYPEFQNDNQKLKEKLPQQDALLLKKHFGAQFDIPKAQQAWLADTLQNTSQTNQETSLEETTTNKPHPNHAPHNSTPMEAIPDTFLKEIHFPKKNKKR